MSIQKRLIVYFISLLFICGAIIGGVIYLIVPLYTGLREQSAALSALNIIIILILISGALIILCALIYSIATAALVARGVVPPLKALVKLAGEIREGNLDCRVEYVGGDEFEPVFREFDSMREKLRRSLREAADYEENRREMIASLAHDIKTPVTSIRAYAEGLKDGIAKTPEARLRYVETILEKAWMVDGLTNDLFLFSKLDIRQDSLVLEPVSTKDYLRSAFDEAARNGAYTLTYESEGIADENIMINKMAFARVLQNITQNSVGHSRVSNVVIQVYARKRDDKVIIRIADNGVGADDDVCERVFERFYQGDKSRSGSGSGLGLTICRRLIEAMNGKIWARSGAGGGFTVYISLPLSVAG
ncbi:MAG: HAMP domain-containing histidine kinase [Clostridiales bacterium]|jgi:histidine kinase|nr:HAMP domain-containing histidine kinase [Clostridiales bacterium]